jgi:nitroreductase
MNLMETIRQRRSARAFKPDPVPEQALQDMLEAARLSPSGGNSQSYLIGVVRDPERKQQLAAAAGGQTWIASAPLVLAMCARLDWDLGSLPADDYGLEVNQRRFGQDFLAYLQAYPDKLAVTRFFENATPLIPGTHIFLVAVSHGLSACWIGDLDIPRANRILGLPDNLTCLYLMPVGYAAAEPKPIRRKTLDEIVFYERWPADPPRE